MNTKPTALDLPHSCSTCVHEPLPVTTEPCSSATPGEQWDALIERALPTDLQPIIAALEEAAEAEERIHWAAAQAHDVPAAHYHRGHRDGLRAAIDFLKAQ
jgi:hypothetical protein